MGRSAEILLLSCRSCFQSFTPAGRAGWGLMPTLEMELKAGINIEPAGLTVLVTLW